MQRVAVVPERHPAVGRHVVHVDVLVKHHHQLALGVNHHQNLLLVHRLDHLAHVAALLLKMLELLAQHSNLGVQLVPLRLQTDDTGQVFSLHQLRCGASCLAIPGACEHSGACLSQSEAAPQSAR